MMVKTQILKPQVDEGIIECKWVHISELDKFRDSMLSRIQYVIDFWLDNLAYEK